MKLSKAIQFHFANDVAHPFEYRDDVFFFWVEHIIQVYNKPVKKLNYIFCSDKYLHSINRQYLQHDDLTDIITFPYHKMDQAIQSDIFISVERIQENAKIFQVTFEKELLRVMAHGLLHLFGFGDKTDSDKAIMRAEEEKCITMFYEQKAFLKINPETDKS